MTRKRRRADHRRDPRRPTIVRRHDADRASGRGEDQELHSTISQALYAGHPIALLQGISAIMAALEPVRRWPGAPEDDADERPTLDALLESFEGTDLTSTTAALFVLAELVSDGAVGDRLRAVAAARPHRLPTWVTRVDEVRVERVVEMRHVLRDGENYVLDVRLPDGFAMTPIVYVDNNLGQVVKDAFVLDQPMDVVLDRMLEEVDPETSLHEVDLALARARIEAALKIESMMVPPMESDTWPAVRPLVRWLVSTLPAGAELPEPEPPNDDELEQIAERFLASPYGDGFGDDLHRGLLDLLLDFGAMYDIGDPLRWSPTNIELLLVDRVPRKVVEKAAVLSKLPRLLRAFVRFAYAERGLSAGLLAEALESVELWEPEYQRLIRTDRVQGAEALARMMMGQETGLELELDLDLSQSLHRLRHARHEDLVEAVGSEAALDVLADEPLPDEPFDWAGLPEDVHVKLAEIVALGDANADALLDVEHRTAQRRLLRDVARANPGYFRGRAAARTSAAAIAYMVANANDSAGSYAAVTFTELLARFGVSSAAPRVTQFRNFLGLPAHDAYSGRPMSLGSPAYLVAARRAELIADRDVLQSE